MFDNSLSILNRRLFEEGLELYDTTGVLVSTEQTKSRKHGSRPARAFVAIHQD